MQPRETQVGKSKIVQYFTRKFLVFITCHMAYGALSQVLS